jgi:hypothetical protein
MSKFLKILEQVDPKNTDKQEMIHKLAELFNLIDSVEVSSDGDSITVSVDGEPIKLAIVEETNEEEAEDATYSIDKGVESLADKPNFGGRFNPMSASGRAKAAVKKRDDIAVKAIAKYNELTKRLESAIQNFNSGSTVNVTR